MKLSEWLLPEFDQEMANTRKTLERVQMENPDWKPHKKSMPLGYMARHIATLPDWITETIAHETWDIAPLEGEKYQVPDASSTEEILALFDKATARARAAIAEVSDEHMTKTWSLLAGGKAIFTLPRFSMVRSLLNHGIHHRAQLGVY
ncbi:MAG: DinB family protein, partial [Blastocatellia bacterium]